MKTKKLLLPLFVLFILLSLKGNTQEVQMINRPFIISQNIKLETDIYFTDTTKKYPVIFLRSPYPRRQYASIANFFVSRGYIMVVQNVRGAGGSGGRQIPFVNETEDGLDMLDLITEQSWCNGSIGMYGASYPGFAAVTLGASGHPSLKAIVHFSGYADPSLVARPSGTNHLMMNVPWLLFNYSQGKILPGKSYNADSLFMQTPVNDILQSKGISLTFEQIGASMGNVNKNFSYKDFNVPIMHVTGMYDFVKEGTFQLYDSLRKYNKIQRIIIGPWVHDQLQQGNRSSKVGDWELPKPAIDSIGEKMLAYALNWFNLHMRTENPDFSKIYQLRALPVFGESFNLNASEYPVEKIVQKVFYLTAKTNANSINGDGKLSKRSTTEKSEDSFTSNPENPVPTFGGANFHFFPDKIGVRDQTEIEKRNDVLVFTADPVSGQLWGLGTATVKLFASWSEADCDFTAKLVAVDPDNHAWILTEGISRMSITDKKPTAYKDANGKTIYEITIDLGHHTFIMKQGWKIRLEIAGSNFPKYDRNPGTGESSILAKKFVPVTQNIFYGKDFPSSLTVETLD